MAGAEPARAQAGGTRPARRLPSPLLASRVLNALNDQLPQDHKLDLEAEWDIETFLAAFESGP